MILELGDRTLLATPRAVLARCSKRSRLDLAKHAMLRHAFCLSQGIAASPTQLVVKGSATFCREVAGCEEAELRAFEEEGKHLQFYSGAAMCKKCR